MNFFQFAVNNARAEFKSDELLEQAALKWLARVEQHYRDRCAREEQVRRYVNSEKAKVVWS